MLRIAGRTMRPQAGLHPSRRRWRSFGISAVALIPAMRIDSCSRHAARHEAADAQSLIAADRPDHGSPCPVRLGDDGILGHFMPLAIDANAVVAAFRFPIDVADGAAVRVGTARSLAALQTVEPLLQR